ncbi:50S ribosomal protein L16 arginine hydroxylase [Saccharobesus litoralis]|uniref:50S ribosomal protein L16 arginine hydroxylase n=1 Tax=Saccharobesus litoralis TaxID=2172099 RepID=A0A2S0VUR0_9ALTE|nr:cupin domain-containing protein [Saccharobesus litoralis]AWB67923.1 50S ribosomal protein L16 arginine hydroxylase [Saccharobesus litoralis]
MYQLSHFDRQAFLTEYWQKKPVLLKGLFTDFQDPIEPDELAGLAAEQEIESRVIARQITEKSESWHVEHGPFEDYSEFGEQGWTLLVQAVDHWWQEGADLVDAFRFIPNWRIDDLMVSFSTPNGGVGPHLDQYDVFIIQGMGKRHWRVGERQTVQDKIPHPDLLQVEGFEACIDQILEPGDVLYIPPGCPHEGYAIENALNYSVGFRAPNQQDFISSFADFALAEECFKQRYADPNLIAVDEKNRGQVSSADKAAIKQLMQACIEDDEKFNLWLGEYLSTAKHDLDIHQPEPHYQIDDIQSMLDMDEQWRKLGGLRTLVVADSLYVNGEKLNIDGVSQDLIQLITGQNLYSSDQLKKFQTKRENLDLLTRLVNQGFLYTLND